MKILTNSITCNNIIKGNCVWYFSINTEYEFLWARTSKSISITGKESGHRKTS